MSELQSKLITNLNATLDARADIIYLLTAQNAKLREGVGLMANAYQGLPFKDLANAQKAYGLLIDHAISLLAECEVSDG